MESENTIIAFGEILWDLLPAGAKLGGAPFNFAYRVNSLGDRGWIVSRLGNDEWGRKAREQAKALGMDTRFLQTDDAHPTGVVEIELDAKGQPDYFITPGVAYDHISITEVLLDAAAIADCICFGTLIQRTDVSRNTLKQVLSNSDCEIKLLDINLRKQCYTTETIVESLQATDILKLNEDEALYLCNLFQFSDLSIPAFCERMMEEWNLTHCLVTLGERGAYAAANAEPVYVPGYRVPLEDSCGSGDAFTAGFIHSLLRGKSVGECCEMGNALGAMVAMQSGATEPIAKEEIQRFMATEHERIVDARLKNNLIIK